MYVWCYFSLYFQCSLVKSRLSDVIKLTGDGRGIMHMRDTTKHGKFRKMFFFAGNVIGLAVTTLPTSEDCTSTEVCVLIMVLITGSYPLIL